MYKPARRRPEFDEARIYEYPQHLRQALADMPAAPGVYVFHSDAETLPLYIGKSVNLRARLLSHLRNPEEARLLRQTSHITHTRTAGEIGALLLEAQCIKAQQPLFNQKLRRNRQLCSLRLNGDGVPEVVYSKDMNFAVEPNLFGLFGSRHKAMETLKDLADTHLLCYGGLGLEKLARGKPCFRHMVKLCAGACCGAETGEQHQRRLEDALETLRVITWPYPGAVGIVERCEDMTQVLVVRNWCFLGSAQSIEEARRMDAVAPGFDADGYKILCRPLLSGEANVIPL